MKAAPIQLQRLSFRRIKIEVDSKLLEQGNITEPEQSLVFDGVGITTNVSVSKIEQEEGVEQVYALTLRVIVDNQPPADGSKPRMSLYLIDIEAGALVVVAKTAQARPDIADIVAVNGTSILWSAIREQVSNLTARMPPGLALLPTVQFQDLRRLPEAIQAPTISKVRKKAQAKADAKPQAHSEA